MNSLPNDIIGAVLSYFKNNKLLKFRCISKKWKKIIEVSVFGINRADWPTFEQCVINYDKFHLLKYLPDINKWPYYQGTLISLSEGKIYKEICLKHWIKKEELETLEYYSSINNVEVIKYMLTTNFTEQIKNQMNSSLFTFYNNKFLRKILQNAMTFSNLDIIKFLHNISWDGLTYQYLCQNIKNNQIEIVKWWYSHNADSYFILVEAARYGNMELVIWLLDKGVNINGSYELKYDKKRIPSALAAAAISGNLEMVKFLVSKGANIHAHDNYAFVHSAKNNHLDIVKYLVDNGANIHTQNEIALIWSAAEGHIDMVEYLVDKGSNIHAQSDLALKLSQKYKHQTVTQYLLNKGSRVGFLNLWTNKIPIWQSN
jgi:hypothetical protein